MYITQSRKETLVLRKREWGYLELEITSDASFLHPVKKQMTTADFIGSMLQVEYLIEKEKLHAGKNYGKLTLKSPYQTLEHTVCVYQKEQREAVPGKAGRTYGTFQNEVQTDGKLYPFPVKTDDIRRVGNWIE